MFGMIRVVSILNLNIKIFNNKNKIELIFYIN